MIFITFMFNQEKETKRVLFKKQRLFYYQLYVFYKT